MTMTAAQTEELRQHDAEYKLRMKYWHVLFYVDGEWHTASERANRCLMGEVYKRLAEYDLDSMCDTTITPGNECTCKGERLRKRQ